MTDIEPAVVVRDLHKDFLLPQHRNSSIKQAFVNIGRKNVKKHQKVLDGISFDVEKGDFFGIVGRNGSGKSTLLKILAGVYVPTAGEVAMNGKLTPFIELGVGFNPELSGRDNVYLNGALLGFNRKEMSAMYDEIVAFAELEPFMDQKLKNYSSGMQVRLAFSIAVKAKNDILIFDEVLAVGDAAFQRKCLDVFEQYKASKQTIILVTHDMETVKKFCNRAILISEGEIVEHGSPYKVANRYTELNQSEIDRDMMQKNKRSKKSNILLRIQNKNGKPAQSFGVGEELTIIADWQKLQGVANIGISIFKESGEHLSGYNSHHSGLDTISKSKQVRLDFSLDIMPGKYYVMAEAYTSQGQLVDAALSGPKFSVTAKDNLSWSGLVPLEHRWSSAVKD